MTDSHFLKAKELLALATNLTTGDIPDDAAIGQLPEWDSLAHMRLILSIEEHIASELSPENVVAILSLQDIEKVLAAAADS